MKVLFYHFTDQFKTPHINILSECVISNDTYIDAVLKQMDNIHYHIGFICSCSPDFSMVQNKNKFIKMYLLICKHTHSDL